MTRALAALALAIVTSILYPQERSPGQEIIRYLEEMALYDESSGSLEKLEDELSELLADPVDINSGDENEVSRLFFLTPFQVKSLVKYSRQRGPLLSVYELSWVPGFDVELAYITAPFVSTGASSQERSHQKSRTFILLNMVLSPGVNDDFPGSDEKMLLKSRHSAGPFTAGLTAEKDRGEVLFDNKGSPDFFSAYMNWKGEKLIRDITIGDFGVRFGQGLVAWTGFSQGSSPLSRNMMKGISRVQPYTSTGENDLFRGLSITSRAGNLSITGFISRNRIDAIVIYPEQGSAGYITSFPDDGLHVSALSLGRKDAAVESSAGINVSHTGSRLSMGASAVATGFSMPVDPGDGIREGYDFRGTGNLALSVDHALTLSDLYIWGEYACNPGSSFAMLQGLRIRPDPRVELNVSYTFLGKGYASFHGNINGDPTVNNFSRSILANITCEVARGTYISGGVIKETDLWYRAYSGSPAASIKYGLSAACDPGERFRIILEIRGKETPRFITPETGIRQPAISVLRSARATVRINPSSAITLTTRMELNRVLEPDERGYLFYQSVSFRSSLIPLEAVARFSIFKTSGYASRIYSWEDDLLYSSSITPSWGEGTRNWLLLKYRIREWLTIRAKYGFTDASRGEGDNSFSHQLRFQVVMNR